MKKTMNPNRFVLGERVIYRNHVTNITIGLYEISRLGDDTIFAVPFLGGKPEIEFDLDGISKHSCNLSIAHQN